HPELLDYLAKEFAARDFDLKFLIKSIALSKAYQLSSKLPPGAEEPEPRLFARMALRGLTGEQLFDSFQQATGQRDATPFQNRIFGGGARQQFLDQFTEQERKTDHHTAIPQALLMMNSPMMADAASPDRGLALGAILDAPFMDDKGRIEALFLSALSRKPTTAEWAKMSAHVAKGKTKAAQRKAMGDVLWALLNSTEFMTNH
ncbi:MAG: DUF1553 domain-containing protein, partial [Gemmataceae bacterium]|nr:DUF1553 domain-containing protein [Gemmataceae bacterium]